MRAAASLILAIALVAPRIAVAAHRGAGTPEALKERLRSYEEKLKQQYDTLKKYEEELHAYRSKLDELTQEREELASKDDLKKYQRKAGESDLKLTFAGQIEARVGFLSLRTRALQEANDQLAPLALSPDLTPPAAALLARMGGLSDLLAANNNVVRPRMILRLYWEINRFFSEDTFLFAYVKPELMFFLIDDDVDRYFLPRDFARPRQQTGFIFKKAAVGAQVGRFSLSVGVLQFTYGTGFFINPTNVWTPKIMLDPLREIDGVPAGQVELTIVQHEKVTLSAQAAAIYTYVRNDLLDTRRNRPGIGGFAMLKLASSIVSLSALGIYRAPNDFGENQPAVGGTISVTPFGLTLSGELLAERHQYDSRWHFSLITTFQTFINALGPAGTNVVVEYYWNDTYSFRPQDNAQLLGNAILAGNGPMAGEVFTRLLLFGRRHYAALYFEPSLTDKLKINIGGLMALDHPGALLRGGVDYQLAIFTLHAYGGGTFGLPDSEFRDHVIAVFAELSLSVTF